MAAKRKKTKSTGLRLKKDGTPAKKPGRQAKVKPELLSTDVYKVLEDMVQKAVANIYPSKDPIEAKKAPAPVAKLSPAGIPRNAQQARIMFEGTKSPLDVPNPDPNKHYYWVSMNPFDQQRAQMNGFTFIVGKDECLRLGYDPITFLNNRARIFYLDVELAWQPKEIADMRRAHMRAKTKDRIDSTTEAFKRIAEKVEGKTHESVTVSKERVAGAGGQFTTDAELS